MWEEGVEQNLVCKEESMMCKHITPLWSTIRNESGLNNRRCEWVRCCSKEYHNFFLNSSHSNFRELVMTICEFDELDVKWRNGANNKGGMCDETI
jgi:hypothetical protein